MTKNNNEQVVPPKSQEEIYLDEAGYTMEIPAEELPKTEEEFNKFLAQESKLRGLMKTSGLIILPSMEQSDVVELIQAKKQEELVFEWAYAHRRNRSMMRQQGKTIAIVPTTQLLLRSSDMLKH